MNSRRLTFVLVRTGVFLVAGLVLFAVLGWSPFAAVAVGLIAAAMAVQFGGVVWLRRTERMTENSPDESPESRRTKPND
ncbi:hypothetical protein SAMN04487820_10374 [Actinopolyspora mzabensis]|uniref:DUF4229 domain-containing protein n=1 Tax=Actinopolyspora mzabensis TaxID=995066 RepID=A0A1G8XUK8_ACTMZ|nr:hypothetical protein [Actinopolyspora mzabensis]SDJ94146.1 hypothetical protein SAMN04487820_10374 [Actinopolyspora mzabensis]